MSVFVQRHRDWLSTQTGFFARCEDRRVERVAELVMEDPSKTVFRDDAASIAHLLPPYFPRIRLTRIGAACSAWNPNLRVENASPRFAKCWREQ
jgi:hypothetical protein